MIKNKESFVNSLPVGERDLATATFMIVNRYEKMWNKDVSEFDETEMDFMNEKEYFVKTKSVTKFIRDYIRGEKHEGK